MPEYLAQRPTWAEIDLDNLAFNFRSVKNFVGGAIKYMAVVKADAYGHGAIPCARRLEHEGVDWFGVALPEEGVELRHAGIRKLILCLGSFWHGQEKLILNNNLTPVVYQLDRAESLDRAAKERNTVVDVHIKIDTGMGRIGVRYDQVAEFADRLREFSNLRVEGLMTHFASADDLADDFTSLQIGLFDEAHAAFRERGFRPAYTDLANSPGAIAHPDARAGMVRLGGVLYGLGDDVLPKGIDRPELRPVMSLHSRIANLKTVPKGESIGYGGTFTTTRETKIATIPIGYQDGYSRALSNNGRVIINGKFAPVAGRVSMDWVTVDVTDIENVQRDNEVILIGQNGESKVTAEELAINTGSISYEITCGIHRRVPRYFLNEM
jgi:alanine racemase